MHWHIPITCGLLIAMILVVRWPSEAWGLLAMYQTLTAGILAVIAAGLGAWALRSATQRQINAAETRQQAQRQHELALENERRDHEVRALARSLSGELYGLCQSLAAYRNGKRDGLSIAKQRADAAKRSGSAEREHVDAPGISSPVFDTNAGRIGLLPATLCRDLAWIYPHLHEVQHTIVSEPKPVFAIPIFQVTYIAVVQRLVRRSKDISERLDHFAASAIDPGQSFDYTKHRPDETIEVVARELGVTLPDQLPL